MGVCSMSGFGGGMFGFGMLGMALSSVFFFSHNRVWALVEEKGAGDVVVFGGGIIPTDDVAALEALGVARLFTPGAALSTIISWLEETLDAREQAASTT